MVSAAGLYYLAELVEEYTTTTAKVIRYTIFCIIAIYVGLLVFEHEFPWMLLICGIAAQFCHLLLLQTFPYLELTSPALIGSLVFICVNHYLAFSHFSDVYYPFSEILSYFTLCQWLVPFTFFISLSANELVLPTIGEGAPLQKPDSQDVVSSYFSRKGKRYGLLTFFNYAKDAVLPERVKKGY
ncbi:PREDICTED: protein TEX261-like [Priapulus caudatus]|uniref:Protein TEX261 n=1 Tax=Priapulus caudatus TaxID=37621 RepID=A0ABM1E157_PRICU|nr:PREDICTED: protein TEX261-like [Priapulus caudatus]